MRRNMNAPFATRKDFKYLICFIKYLYSFKNIGWQLILKFHYLNIFVESMNRRISFNKHKKNCADKTKGNNWFKEEVMKAWIWKTVFLWLQLPYFTVTLLNLSVSGAKLRNLNPYQCPSPSMAHKSAGSFIGSFQSKFSDFYQ